MVVLFVWQNAIQIRYLVLQSILQHDHQQECEYNCRIRHLRVLSTAPPLPYAAVRRLTFFIPFPICFLPSASGAMKLDSRNNAVISGAYGTSPSALCDKWRMRLEPPASTALKIGHRAGLAEKSQGWASSDVPRAPFSTLGSIPNRSKSDPLLVQPSFLSGPRSYPPPPHSHSFFHSTPHHFSPPLSFTSATPPHMDHAVPGSYFDSFSLFLLYTRPLPPLPSP